MVKLFYFIIFLAAAEGAYLCMFSYHKLKSKDKKKEPVNVTPSTEASEDAR